MEQHAKGTSMTAAGTLYIVGMPIGNLADLSTRSTAVLGEVDLIAAEDTRRTGRLLSRIGVQTRLIAYHEHNEDASAAGLIERLQAGAKVALVADAGMPLISDPGWRLVSQARAAGIAVVSVPGPSAVIAALSVSGLPTERFCFEGFLPRAAGRRSDRLAVLAAESRTMVFFESVHRLAATLAEMQNCFGAERPAAIARELTKLHESVHSGGLGDLVSQLGNAISIRGEFVILIGGKRSLESAGNEEVSRIYALLAAELTPDRALKLAIEITGRSRNEVYRLTRR
jgi:16S rRNA (cytidine1402-2'-O)-methyltransferase